MNSAQNGTIGIQLSWTITPTPAMMMPNQRPKLPPLMTLNAVMIIRTPMINAAQPQVVRSLARYFAP